MKSPQNTFLRTYPIDMQYRTIEEGFLKRKELANIKVNITKVLSRYFSASLKNYIKQ
jgi:hypothetical protein